ncbi:Gp138 family membrane-puncturing spike protein [Pseudomonas oryzihabitans]|uniref:Phage protein Gp138 N-terminal domain-containing protein n=1 Tax=Pseudomonas oryzihabitans TaxID=47885 RepID=A0AAJ2EVR8_9PSED|nr:Gp138 family membrane-puncturing spike protein [Pseudomonas psychrotolerans]MDR6234028.1 hypothetical protein [Pseudomonas psychrotolerans]MDR6356876.1 hypothetical protein [Pseudomonas psychrotolerans]
MSSPVNDRVPVMDVEARFGPQAVQLAMIREALDDVRTTTLVQVVSVTNDGGLEPVGLVDVQILVKRVDGAAQVMDAGIVYNVPYMRLQGGANAIILDPQVGDIGIALMADRDISSVKATKAAEAPGSNRKHDMADALYLGGVLNGVPQQYVRFTAGGIEVVSPTKVTVKAPDVALIGNVAASGGTFTHNGVNVGAKHVHSGVQAGSAQTQPPQ